MDQQTYLSLMPEERAAHVQTLLRLIVLESKKDKLCCKHAQLRTCSVRFDLEQKVLQIIAWEKEEADE